MIIPVQNGQLPNGFCPAGYQDILNGFSAVQFVDISVIASIIVSATPPGAADHDKAWLQLDSLGRPVRLYFFAGGAWLSKHPLPPGFTMLWNQALPNFQTFDGGDANAAPYSDISGQMWQVMAATLDGLSIAPANDVMAARFPVGVGTFPAPPTGTGTVVGVTGSGGEEIHKLSNPEMFPHQHAASGVGNAFVVAGGESSAGGAAITNWGFRANTAIAGGDPTTGTPPTDSLGHENKPPYYGVYFLQRTNRIYYRV